MMELRLKPKVSGLTIPLEAEVISPDVIAGKTLREVEELRVYHGNRAETLGEYFEVEGEVAPNPEEQLIVVDGDVPWVKYIGAGMTAGRVVVRGDAGMHLGSKMAGGEIVVEGSVGDWAGAEMAGGFIRIRGDAGDLLGAAYRGSPEGMRGGCIYVEGSAGYETGTGMRRGLIVIGGDAAPFTGAHMNGGVIFIFGRAAKRLGAQMRGNGSLIICLGEVEELLPTFVYDTTYTPTFMRIYLKTLSEKLGIKRAEEYIGRAFRRYRGDRAVGGDGEILIVERG